MIEPPRRPRRRRVAVAVGALTVTVVGARASSSPPRTCVPHQACAKATPGVLNPEVTSDNVAETICVPGWTATIRPNSSYTSALKAQQIAEYGYTDTDPSHYEEDHKIPLSSGGHPTAAANLWPQPIGQARIDDKVEVQVQRDICAGTVTLAEGQRKIVEWKDTHG